MADSFSNLDDTGPFEALLPYLGGLLGLVVAMTGIFWVVGQVAGGDEEMVAAPSPTATETFEPEPTEPPPTGTATAASPSPEPTATGASPTPTATASIAAGDIDVQVLDGGGGEGATALAEQLRGDDYNVVAENEAIAYEETTVFYTEGNEAAAEQIAAQYDLPVVDSAPDNLSTEVDVHIVVGSDMAE